MADTTLMAAFLAARKEMKDPRQSGSNPHFGSTFVPRDEVLDAVIPVLLAHGIVLTQGYEDGALATTIHGYGESLVLGRYPVPQQPDPQKFMAAGTYASRGSLMLGLALAGDKDDDGNTASKPSGARWGAILATAKKSKAKAAAIHDKLAEWGVEVKSAEQYEALAPDAQNELASIAGV